LFVIDVHLVIIFLALKEGFSIRILVVPTALVIREHRFVIQFDLTLWVSA
jgi:hypothetical protein